ncbi:MAG: hypothetical protein FJX70_07675 [Alphaproteobacteria bacterium]|nr:hypothetical protein [Alphaproteobacteria bacterium]
MSNFAEQQTEWILNNILVNGGWIIDNLPKKNVYFQKARPEHQHLLENFSNKKGYKKPDYILYKEDKLAGIIEAKRGGESLDKALKQATEYAEMLKAPLVFASNGAYVETYHLTENKPLFINGEKVDRLIKYKEAVEFIKSGKNEIYTFPPELIKSKEDLIRIFKKVNNLLRKANIFAGYDRISEFSSILFLKLISEQEGEKSYWNSIKKQDDDFLLSYLNGTVIKTLEDKYNGGVFSEINLKKASVMRQIINIVDPLVLSDIKTDIKGDAFEYFLKNMNQADNDLGQYFTPRHIVKAMVHLINPKFKETIYDPFCGTGGFLIEAFNHIKENSIIKTEEERKILRENTLFGRDATKVSTIAKKNMILHGDGHSNIEEKDSLEHPIEKKMSAILTNIPFSLKDVDYTDSYYHGLGKKNGDAICVLHCLDALEEGGRMALVVPEGFLFKKELKEIRKFLLSRANLELIVSLPQGVFLPYTGVKTDILYFSNAHKPEVREGYYYFEVKNDGFTLDAHRRKIESVNDIHKLEAINIRKGEKELLKEQGFEFIDFEKVRANDYNLVGSVYRELKKSSGYKIAKLSEVCSIDWGNTNLTKEIYLKNGKYEVFSASGSDGLSNDFEHTGEAVILSAIGARCGKCFYAQGKWTAIKNTIIIRPLKNQEIILKYLFYILNNEAFWNKKGGAQPFITLASARNQYLPLPSLEEQKKIVDELDSYHQIVESITSSIRYWKPYFEIDKNWKIIKIGDYIETKYGYTAVNNNRGDFRYLRTTDISDSFTLKNKPVFINTFDDIDNFLIKKHDVFITRSGSVGKSFIALEDMQAVFASYLVRLRFNQSFINPLYFLYYSNTDNYWSQVGKLTDVLTQPNLNAEKMKMIEMPLPPLHIQQEIVGRLEQEHKMIDSQKEIIKLFEAKIQNKLNSIWQFEEENKINK